MSSVCEQCKNPIPEDHGISINLHENPKLHIYKTCPECSRIEFWKILCELFESAKSNNSKYQTCILDRLKAFENKLLFIHTNPKCTDELENVYDLEGFVAGISEDFGDPFCKIFLISLVRPFGQKAGDIQVVYISKSEDSNELIIKVRNDSGADDCLEFVHGGISQPSGSEESLRLMLFRNSEIKRNLDHERIKLASDAYHSLSDFNFKFVFIVAIIISAATFYSLKMGLAIAAIMVIYILVSIYQSVRLLIKLETMKYNDHRAIETNK